MVCLDNAATTYPKPQRVIDALKRAEVSYGGNPGRSGHTLSLNAGQAVYDTRKSVAEFFGAEPEHVVFTSNCTHALNQAIYGVTAAGGHVVTSCLEHNSVARPLHYLEKQGKITITCVSVTGSAEEVVAAFEEAIRPDTIAVICTHASNLTGRRLPIELIGPLCQKRGVAFVVDAAQTAGLLPIHIKKMGIDFLCTAGHKGLYGVRGTGLLILGSDCLVSPLMRGGTGSLSLEPEQPELYPDRLESGTVNMSGILALQEGISFLRRRNPETIYKHEMALCQHVFVALQKMELPCLDPTFCSETHVPVLSFCLPGYDSERVTEQLNEAGIAVRGGFHCTPWAHAFYGTLESGAVRMSPGAFTTQKEIDYFVKQVNILRNYRKHL